MTELPVNILKNPLVHQRLVREFLAFLSFHSGITKRSRAKAVKKQSVVPWRILRYRHIIDPKDYPFMLQRNSFVTPKSFEKNLKFLSKHFKILPLEELLYKIDKKKRIKPNTLSITFDCAYNDFYFYAFPLLQKYRVPATVFVPTGYPDTPNMFWDEVLRMSLGILLSENISFPEIEGLTPEFYDIMSNISQDNIINIGVIDFVIDFLLTSPISVREKVYNHILKLSSMIVEIPESYMFCSWSFIKEMYNSGIITFASNGHSYNEFNLLEEKEIEYEIETSFKMFEKHNIPFIKALAFPRGIFNNTSIINLGIQKIRFALAEAVIEEVNPNKHGTIVLERVNIDQSVASFNEILAARIVAVTASSQKYQREHSLSVL